MNFCAKIGNYKFHKVVSDEVDALKADNKYLTCEINTRKS